MLGAGALGSIIAGHLALAGEDVTLIARGERARYLQQNGITITGQSKFNTDCVVVSDPSILSHADVLIVAVKSHDTDSAISSVDHLKVSSVLSVQNGWWPMQNSAVCLVSPIPWVLRLHSAEKFWLTVLSGSR